MNESGFSGRIHWIPLSAQIQKTKKKKHKKKGGQIKMARIYVWEYVNKSPLYLFPLDFCSGIFFTSLPPNSLSVPRPTFQGTRGAYKLLKCRCKYLTASCCQFKLKTLPQKLQLDKQTRHKLLQSSLTLLLPALTALPPQFTHMI